MLGERALRLVFDASIVIGRRPLSCHKPGAKQVQTR